MEFGTVDQEEISFEDIFIWSTDSIFVQQTETISAILIEGVMRNSSVKLFWIWTSGSGWNVV